jgi:hypothetical protein
MSQLGILGITIIGPSSTKPMENLVSTTETLLSERLLFKDTVELVHSFLILILGIDQGEWTGDLFRVGGFEERGVDDGSSFE